MQLTVASVMTSDVFAVAPDTNIETAARLLTTKHITGAPVVAEDGKPVGVVSMTDLLDPDGQRSELQGYPMFYRIAAGGSSETLGDGTPVGVGRVEDVMSPFVLAIEPSATVVDAANRMVVEGVHRLLVMDQGRLVGIVSALDLLRGMVEAAAAAGIDIGRIRAASAV